MHATALADMSQLLDAAQSWAKTALDVGSLDENGTNRPLTDAKGWQYTGIDIRQGPNVDIVVQPYAYPFEDNSFDVVLSGQAMEHVEDLKAWLNECVRVLRPGGRLCITTVWKMFYHPFPVDCWRIMPDGMRWLFDQNGQLQDYDIRMTSEDQTGGNIIGAATKKGQT
jgi:SAM-dependent methyltransferase